MFFRERELVAEARVIKVHGNGIIVLVPKFGIEGPVYFQESADAEEMTQGGTSPAAGQQVCFRAPNSSAYRHEDRATSWLEECKASRARVAQS